MYKSVDIINMARDWLLFLAILARILGDKLAPRSLCGCVQVRHMFGCLMQLNLAS
jgi:hypothetical protein